MPLTNVAELRAYLAKLGAQPKKSLSQNFLIDSNIVSKILGFADVREKDSLFEIGPGPGGMSEALLELGVQLTAVERDRVFAKALGSRFPTCQVFEEDILAFDLDQLTPGSKVVANLPYHITAPILTRLTPRRDLFSSITVMVQEEVARRLTAQPGSKIYGSLSVYMQFYTRPRYGFRVSRHCFYPEPNVDSAVVRFDLIEPPLDDPDAFFELVRLAFGKRRKMIRKTLGSPEKILEAGIDPTARPEQLSLEQFIRLYKQFIGG